MGEYVGLCVLSDACVKDIVCVGVVTKCVRERVCGCGCVLRHEYERGRGCLCVVGRVSERVCGCWCCHQMCL